MKKTAIFLICFLLFSSSFYAEDNVTTGTEDTQTQQSGYGFYRSRDCMYKVSVYIGNSNTANVRGDIQDFTLLGEPLILARSDFKPLSGYTLRYTPYNKIQYLQGERFTNKKLPDSNIILQSTVPPIPIINKGKIPAVKSFFGDTKTLDGLLSEIAVKQGMSKESLLEGRTYQIDGKNESLSMEELLPQLDENGVSKNKVPYLIVYEPIAVGYLNDGKTALAFTATEYALASKEGYFNFFNQKLGGDYPQLMWGLTHRDLPNSTFLEESWFGFQARVEMANIKATSLWTTQKIEQANEAIVAGSGWGMRFLGDEHFIPLGKEGGPSHSETNGSIALLNHTYRTGTEVITSVLAKVPPSSGEDIFNPDSKATVTFQIGSEIKKQEIILPNGGSQLAWVKWKTPNTPGIVHIKVTGSEGLSFIDNSTTEVQIIAEIVGLSEKTPPDPKAKDTAASIGYLKGEIPKESMADSNTWGEYHATWHEHLVDNGDWKRGEDKKPIIPLEWEEKWEDEGWWDWEFKTYEASLKTEVQILPSDETPTAKKSNPYGNWQLKSGYGVKIEVKPILTTDAPDNSHYAKTGNSIVFFPEFNYKEYFRILQKKSGIFSFTNNVYSHFNAPVHFTPLWFPDGEYTVYTQTFDYWTPAGMLSIPGADSITIEGDVYDDWQATPVYQSH